MKRQENIDEVGKLFLVVFDGDEDPDEDGTEKWVAFDGGVRVVDQESYGQDGFRPKDLVWNVGVTGVDSEGFEEEGGVKNSSGGQPACVNAHSTSEENVFLPEVKMAVSADVKNLDCGNKHDCNIK